ncbi:putative peptidase family-domain-containing protein [Aspergillus californicus]
MQHYYRLSSLPQTTRMTKRSMDTNADNGSTPTSPKRRVQPTPIAMRSFEINNLTDGETVHQTCISIHGQCPEFDYAHETNYISVSATDSLTNRKSVHLQPDTQNWPLHKGSWKALVLLSPGQNTLDVKLHHAGGIHDSLQLTVTYIPLLQLPPLHLAILVAKDSPLVIDCPPGKYGAISSAHSSLNAAIAKFRLAAYMWQALTAEDFREKGLGRRSFRLEEEWTRDSTLLQAIRTTGDATTAMRSVPKVHIIRSDKTVAEIQDAQVAQQNPRGRDREALHRYFETALATSGPPFESTSRPVVAGMVLDSHYSVENSMILGHAALGCHKSEGISLGIFGSHLAYSWPRFLEEVPACLVDGALTGDTVGNDNGECDTMRGACFVGQGAFLHEVGHAFGAGHTTGIMARGYSKTWARNFIDHESLGNLGKNEAKWDLRDVLLFKLLPHFALPGDGPVLTEFKHAPVKIEVNLDEDGDEVLNVSCTVGLAQVTIKSGEDDPIIYYADSESGWKGNCPVFGINMKVALEESKFDRDTPLKVTGLGINGKERTVKNAWTLLKEKPYITIPDSNVVLRKQAVQSDRFESNDNDDEAFIPWALLLQHRGKDRQLHRATSIDLRVGCTMDGAVVYYGDGSHENCGPARDSRGQPHTFGGHASSRHDLPAGETIAKVVVNRDDAGWGSLAGIRMVLGNGQEWGHLNNHNNDSNDSDDDEDRDGAESEESVVTLEPADDEVIVGFYGQSDKHSGFTDQFGILTAPRDVQLPEIVYDIPGLSNA